MKKRKLNRLIRKGVLNKHISNNEIVKASQPSSSDIFSLVCKRFKEEACSLADLANTYDYHCNQGSESDSERNGILYMIADMQNMMDIIADNLCFGQEDISDMKNELDEKYGRLEDGFVLEWYKSNNIVIDDFQ